MSIENDPAVLPEEQGATVTDPQVMEEQGESSAEDAGEGAGTGAGSDSDSSTVMAEVGKPQAEEHDLVVAGDEPVTKKVVESPEKAKERNREFSRLRARTAELERKLAEKERALAPAALDPGPKPTLENCDFDASAYEAKLDTWHEKRRQKEAADAVAAQETQKAQGDRQQKQLKYLKSKEEIMSKLPDYQELETLVAAGLSETQREVILHYADNPTLVVAALGRNPERLQDFADTKDLGALIAKTAKLEVRTELKSKTTPPPPEKRISGSGSKSGKVDTHLDMLRARAEKSGDYTKVNDYIREKRRAQR